MNINIYVRNNENVEIFAVKFDIEKFKSIQNKIDLWNGKGKLRRATRASLSSRDDISLFDKKIEIVSKTYAYDEKIEYKELNLFGEISVYNFEYYAYQQHPLSKFCDVIIGDYKTLHSSMHIKDLIEWKSDNKEDLLFVKELLCCFEFNKLDTYDVNKNVGILDKILDVFRKTKSIDNVIVYPKNYEDSVEDEIRRIELIEKQNNNNDNFIFDFDEKNKIKRKILTSLPNRQQIKSNN